MNEDFIMSVLKMAMNEGSTDNKSDYSEDVGKNVFIQTVTHHYTGKLVKAFGDRITLENACWIADDGRLNEAMKDSNKFKEVEPFPNPIKLNTGSFLLLTEIDTLPTEVK